MNDVRLFCLTFAGGNAAFYNAIEKELCDSVEVIKLEYSGHGKRYKELLYHSFDELVDDIYPLIKNKTKTDNKPYAILGYSMGSIAASVILKRILDKKEILAPKHLFLAAHEPLSRHDLEDFLEEEMDDYVKERTIQFGDISEELLNNKAFWKVYLPIYRADYVMISKFDFSELKENAAIPATVFYSEEDTPYRLMRGWKRFYKKVDFIRYEGSHFFVREHMKEMANEIIKHLECI